MHAETAPLPDDPITAKHAARIIARPVGYIYRKATLRRLRCWRVGASPDGRGGSLVFSEADVRAMVTVTGPQPSGHEVALAELRRRGLACG